MYFRDYPAMESDSFTLHQHWTKGILPHKGGLKDQPAIFSVIVFSVEAGINAAKVTQQEIAEAQAELQGRIRNKGH